MKASAASSDKKSLTWKERRENWKQTHPHMMFALQTAGFYLLLLVLYLYFMLANLSAAPKFVYTAF